MTDLLRILLVAACGAPVLLAALQARGEEEDASGAARVYFGTYSGGPGQGVFMARMDRTTGRLFGFEHAGEAVKPSFVAVHPSGKYFYAVSEVDDHEGKKSGGVRAFSVDGATGKLTKINDQPSEGRAPCFVTVHPSGQSLFVANYSAGTVASFPIADDGSLGPATSRIQHEGSGPVSDRQEGPHAHSINLSPDGKFALACDLGTDEIRIYRVEAKTGKLTPHEPSKLDMPPGSGPRHLTFAPDGKRAYVINELANTIGMLEWNAAKGSLELVQTVSTLPEDFSAYSKTAEILVHPSGKFVYGSNRGHDSIAVFAVDPATGELTRRGFATESIDEPRNFRIDPSGKFLLVGNQNSDSIVVYAIDPESGALTLTDSKIEVPSPVCIRFADQP